MRALWQGLRALWRRRQAARELEAELDSYEELAAAASSAREAKVALGGRDAIRERVGDIGWERWLAILGRDLRYGWRGLRRSPGFTTVAVLTLALGIGANTAIFSLVYAALVRPAHFPEADRLVWISAVRPSGEKYGVSGIELSEWGPTLDRLFAAHATFVNHRDSTWRIGERGLRLFDRGVSGPFFSLLGARAFAGRLIGPGDRASEQDGEAVLGYAFWQHEFGGDIHALGQRIREKEGGSFTIIGVLPPNFEFDATADVWTTEPPQAADEADMRGYRPFQVLGRLRPGVPLAAARAAMDVVGEREAREHAKTNAGWRIASESLAARVHENRGEQDGHGVLLLWAAAGCLLLIACTNVSNLLLARAAGRRAELAIRLALGCSRRRLVAQLMTESGLLALLGAGVGIAWAAAALRLLDYWGSLFLPAALVKSLAGWHANALNYGVLAMTAAITVAAVLAFGLVPALEATRGGPRHPAAAEMQKKGMWGRPLMTAQVAMVMMLLVMAGLFARSFIRLLAVDPGFQTGNRLSFQVEITLPGVSTPGDAHARWQRVQLWFDKLERRLGSLPGVSAVGASNDFPILDDGGGWEGSVIGGKSMPTGTTMAFVSPGYFAAMGVPLLAGREFNPARDQREGVKAMILNQTMARLVFPHGNAVGRRLDAPRCGLSLDSGHRKSPCEVVGVVGDLRYRLGAPPPPTFFFSTTQDVANHATFEVRAAGDAAKLAPQVRAVLAHMPQELVGAPYVFNLQTMQQAVAASVATPRFQTWLVGLFAGLALLLAAIGVYGVQNYAVQRRTREIGIRMALGADPAQLFGGVVGAALGQMLPGIAIGLAGGLLAARGMTSLLFGVRPWDPTTLVLAPLLLLAAAVLAALSPARKAIRVDPLAALRED